MEKQKCQRCNGEDEIPTHQYIKFDQRRYDLCTSCWDVFNNWLYGRALKEPRPNPGKQYSSGIITGREPAENLITGREPTKVIALKEVIAGDLERWLSSPTGKDNDNRVGF